MNYEQMKEALRKERERIAAESHKKIEAINQALVALEALNGQPKALPVVEKPTREIIIGRSVKKMWVRRRETGAMILKRLDMHYTDVCIDAIRKAGRPVTTEEVYLHLQKMAGKKLARRLYMDRITVCLNYAAKRGKLVATKMPGASYHQNLWNVAKASDLQTNQELVSADIK